MTTGTGERPQVDATLWCVGAVDRAVRQLTAEIADLRVDDLGASCGDSVATRHERIIALAVRMGHEVTASDTGDGRWLSAVVSSAWAQHRARLDPAGTATRRNALELLADVQVVHAAIALDITARDARR